MASLPAAVRCRLECPVAAVMAAGARVLFCALTTAASPLELSLDLGAALMVDALVRPPA